MLKELKALMLIKKYEEEINTLNSCNDQDFTKKVHELEQRISKDRCIFGKTGYAHLTTLIYNIKKQKNML